MTPRRSDDRGFSLIELLISMGLFAIVITIVGSMIISAITADRTVREVTSSTTDGQLAVNVIEQTVRNSTAIQVTTAADGASTMMALRTTAGGAARCHAFFYDAPSSTILERTASTAITAPIPGEVGSEWNAVSTDIMPLADAGGTAEPVFAAQGARGVSIGFTADGDSGPASLFVTSATGRGPQSNASPQCF